MFSNFWLVVYVVLPQSLTPQRSHVALTFIVKDHRLTVSMCVDIWLACVYMCGYCLHTSCLCECVPFLMSTQIIMNEFLNFFTFCHNLFLFAYKSFFIVFYSLSVPFDGLSWVGAINNAFFFNSPGQCRCSCYYKLYNMPPQQGVLWLFTLLPDGKLNPLCCDLKWYWILFRSLW